MLSLSSSVFYYLLLLLAICDLTLVTAFDKYTDCFLIPTSGTCSRTFYRMYYYDSRTQTCKQFSYGGCGGNANLFESEALCLRACSGVGPQSGRRTSVPLNVNSYCLQPPYLNCGSGIPKTLKYYYDPNLGVCYQTQDCYRPNGPRLAGFDDESVCMENCNPQQKIQAAYTLVPKTYLTPPPPPPAPPKTTTTPAPAPLRTAVSLLNYRKLTGICSGELYGTRRVYSSEECSVICDAFQPACAAFSLYVDGRCEIKNDCSGYPAANPAGHIESWMRNSVEVSDRYLQNRDFNAVGVSFSASQTTTPSIGISRKPLPSILAGTIYDNYHEVGRSCFSPVIKRNYVRTEADCAYSCEDTQPDCNAFSVYVNGLCELKDRCDEDPQDNTASKHLSSWIRKPSASGRRRS